MEDNTVHNFTTTKRALSKGNSFKCMIKGTSLTSLYTQLDILSLPLVCTYFSPSILKLSWHTVSPPLESFCWNTINSLMLHSWSYKPYKDRWLCFHISKFTSLSTWLLQFLNTYYIISTTITTINQSYYIKHILFIISTILMIVRLWALPIL